MVFDPIYDRTALFIYVIWKTAIMIGPPSVSAFIAAEKGRNISVWICIYMMYSFFIMPAIHTFIFISLSGSSQYIGMFLYPVFLLSPIWHSLRLMPTPALQHASKSRGVILKSCVYCGESIKSDSNICPYCHYRTMLSLIKDWRALFFAVSVMVFLLAFFAAADEFVSDVHAYNMISPFLLFSQAFLYAFVTASIGLAIVCVIQLAAIWGILYSIGTIFNTAYCLTRGKEVRHPIVLFYVASYITWIHPILFAHDIGKSGETVIWEFSLGWWLWILSYGLMILALHLLRDKNNDSNIQAPNYMHKS